MRRCPNCNYENEQTSSYCERCGNFLTSSMTYTDPEEARPTYRASGENSTPPSYGYQQPISDYQYQAPAEYAQGAQFGYQEATPLQIKPRTRTVGEIIFSIVLYLWGAFCMVFGFAGGVLNQAPSGIVGLAFILGCLLGIILLIPILIFHKSFYLRWWVRLLLEAGITILALVALFIGVGILAMSMHYTKTPLQYLILGSILMVYGFVVAALANW